MTSGRDEYLEGTHKHIDYDKEAKLRVWHLNNTGGTAHDGLTVRDYFAAEAMAALLIKQDPKVVDVVEEAYEWADMMMKERAK